MAKQLFPNEKIIITKYFDVHQDWDVSIPGFFIIASKTGKVSLDEFNNEEADEFFSLVRKLRRGMREVLRIETVCFFQDEGTHHLFHLWIFPRYEWMNKFGEKIESIRPIINYAKENMANEKVLSEVKEMVKQMRDYMKPDSKS
ncbi:MAG: diadenosine tetraphosphate hydrolase [Patescibacteria group bacterium]|nr:diadenosine tetraphosphate hydrolase [Patescibacteria group bacterium]